MDKFIAYLLPGIFTGAAYAIAASGLVLTYTTTRVFNIAHGAFGMLMSFVFWEFTVTQGIPQFWALLLVVGVVAPAIGVVIQRFVARGLGDAPVGVGLIVTVGMFVGVVGLAQKQWPSEARFVEPFFADSSWQVGDSIVTAQQLITILASVAVAVGLYLLLTRTRIGTAMRASVDNPELLKLFGGRPDTAAAISWALGISLSALAGILLVPVVGLDYFALTLLVVNAYAAAMVGRLKSLPLTFAGAMALGILDSLALGYIPPDSFLTNVRPALPALFLFAMVILLPQSQLRIGQVKGLVSAPVPTLTRSLVSGAGFLVVGLLLVTSLSEVNLLKLGAAATFAIIMLSLMLLTGYGGHVSLAQLSFAGVGALAYAKLDEPNLYGLVMATLIAAGVGALVALPVLRLTGLFLALATLAFGVLMDKLVFQDERAFGYGGALPADRLSILGRSIESTSAYVMVMLVFLTATGVLLLALRRGRLGRMLIALRDSPAACGTLGLDARWFRVGLFALSAGVAGLAGALYAGLRGTIGASDFQFFSSLPLLLLVVVFGVTSVTGAVMGGVGLMLLNGADPSTQALLFVIIGFGAVFAGRDPNGLANLLFRGGRLVQDRLTQRVLASLPDLPGRGRGDADVTEAGLEVVEGEPLAPTTREGVPSHATP
jgi:branched-chain amino acid transport system permease protein